MAGPKYYDAILRQQADQQPAPSEFNFNDVADDTLPGRIGVWLFENPWTLTKFLRAFRPVASIRGLRAVTRYDDVKEIFDTPHVFEVPFGLEMAEMSGGANFILGMKYDDEGSAAYTRQRRHMNAAFLREDIDTIVKPLAWRFANEILDNSNGRLNAIGGLITPVATKICESYYGVPILDEDAFADWALSLSILFFGDPFGKPKIRRMALAAAPRMQGLVDDAITLAKAGRIAPNTVLARLVALQSTDPEPPTDAEIRAILIGMMTGFVPTDTVAGAHMLSVVLEKPEALRDALAAAAGNNDTQLWAILKEAMRFRPLNFGPFRYCNKRHRLKSGRVIPAGATVLASTLSAMQDPRRIPRPAKFDATRGPEQYIFFGYGMHACYGAMIADAHITQTLKALFQRPGFRAAPGEDGKLKRLGPIPRRQIVEFDQSVKPLSEFSMVTICVPLVEGAVPSAVQDDIARLGNPACAEARKAFEQAGCLHFVSLGVIRGEGDEPTYAVLEMSADGSESDAIAAVAASAGSLLRPIFEQGCGLAVNEDLGVFLTKHAIEVGYRKANPGLLFCGTPGFTVERIRLEEALEEKITNMFDAKLSSHRDGEGLRLLNDVRAELRAEGGNEWAFRAEATPFLEQGDKPLDIPKIFKTPRILGGLAALTVTLILIFGFAYGGGENRGVFINFLSILAAIIAGAGAALLLVVGIIGGIILNLRRKERADPANDFDPDPAAVEALLARENIHLQNHMTGVSYMKPGRFRKFVLRFMYFYVTQRLSLFLRPGYLNEIGTIHFARWVLLPKTNKLIFYSNYAGTWESYMEDFITKAYRGLTGVWSNTKDFPRTRALLFEGSQDGDRFKRWARRQQIPTPFWFSAYPDISPERIRVNAAIRDGIARARTESEAVAWRALFGSQPKPAKFLEDHEVQAIVFSGMGKLKEGECLAVRLPDGDIARARAWLHDYFSETRPQISHITFGDVMPTERATFVALTATGLAKLGLGGDETGVRNSFPVAFTHGMATPSRSRLLADQGKSAPEGWLWGAAQNAVDAAIFIYARDRAGLDAAREIEMANLARANAVLVHRVDMKLTFPPKMDGVAEDLKAAVPYFRETPSIEPFGFADGISQPLIRGTRKWYEAPSELHAVEAGEMILGYPDNRGFYPPTPQVTAKQDAGNDLPVIPQNLPGRWPQFGSESVRAYRDIGRNGSFLVVRQLEQHVAEFNAYLISVAASLREEWPDQNITPEWIAAKMVGRWKDGTSLVRNPSGTERPEIDNDFLLGRDDPQGLKCPLGAHIRRANPRDSLKPGDTEQLAISNRHRIFRVGRPYVETTPNGGVSGPRGLLFMAINADIERQFEFIHRTWIVEPYFHGLGKENDPLIAPVRHSATFTIPTHRGPITLRNMETFVTTRGGGYFFLPSRSALRFLSRVEAKA